MAQYVPVCFVYNKRYTNNFFSKDVDECADMTLASTCSQNCVNTYGSFECQCNSGFELAADGRTCNGKRFNKFLVLAGMTSVCSLKLSLLIFSIFSDVNECTRFLHNCTQICINTIGSFNCSCQNGFNLQNDSRSCVGKKASLSFSILLRSCLKLILHIVFH